jgi:hypothetical protein
MQNRLRHSGLGLGSALTMYGKSLFHTWDGIRYLVLTNPNTGTKLRWGVRDGYDVEDITLTPLGFDGVENTDWENVSAIEL